MVLILRYCSSNYPQRRLPYIFIFFLYICLFLPEMIMEKEKKNKQQKKQNSRNYPEVIFYEKSELLSRRGFYP